MMFECSQVLALENFVNTNGDSFQESVDPSATKKLIEDLLLHSETDNGSEFLSLTAISNVTSLPKTPSCNKRLQKKRYGNRELELLESAGVLVRNPLNSDEIKLADFL
jgi:hypothetical protein